MLIVLTMNIFVGAEESMSAGEVQGVQMQVKGRHAPGNHSFL